MKRSPIRQKHITGGAAGQSKAPAPAEAPVASVPAAPVLLNKREIEAKRLEDLNDDELDRMLMAPRPGYVYPDDEQHQRPADDEENRAVGVLAAEDSRARGSGAVGGSRPHVAGDAGGGRSSDNMGSGGGIGLPKMFPSRRSKDLATAAAYGHPPILANYPSTVPVGGLSVFVAWSCDVM